MDINVTITNDVVYNFRFLYPFEKKKRHNKEENKKFNFRKKRLDQMLYKRASCPIQKYFEITRKKFQS
jgi:hypothetical protein